MTSGLAPILRGLCTAGLVLLMGLSVRAANTPQTASAPAQVRQTMHELWKANITSIQDKEDPAMRKAISDVRSIDGLHKEAASRPAESAVRPLHVEASEGLAVRRSVSPAKLEELRKQVANNPQECLLMADSLFETGQFESSEVVYQELLAGKGNEVNKDWLLLQVANCRRLRDPATARATYVQLLSESPEGPWTAVAQEEIRLIDWTAVNNPQGVMDAAEDRTSSSSSSAPASGLTSSASPATTTATAPARSMPAASAPSSKQ